MQIIQKTQRKKQNITTVGLKILIDYFMVIKTNIEGKHTSVNVVCTASQKKTYSSNIKKIVKV